MTASTLPDNCGTTAQPPLVLGSLCTGYGGLDMGVAAALGGNARLAWVADHDPAAARLLSARFPGIGNLGDMACVNWSQVPPVDVLTAGFPCQDISAAGTGAGLEKGERSSVWTCVMDAVRHLRPPLLVLENVAALRWRGRGFDRVLGDLASAGYDTQWCCVRASDVGAPHQRERVFVAAHPVRQRRGTRYHQRTTAPGAGAPRAGGRCAVPPTPHPHLRTHCAHHQQHPHARAAAAHTAGQRCHQRQPAAEGFTRQPQFALDSHRYAQPHNAIEIAYAQPPFAYAWGVYEPAIRRWEQVLGRPAPPPTDLGKRRQPRLNAGFVEWMMGLPPGWVTDPDLALPRTAQLRALGNGVVPQQAEYAVRHLLAETPHAGPEGAAWD